MCISIYIIGREREFQGSYIFGAIGGAWVVSVDACCLSLVCMKTLQCVLPRVLQCVLPRVLQCVLPRVLQCVLQCVLRYRV